MTDLAPPRAPARLRATAILLFAALLLAPLLVRTGLLHFRFGLMLMALAIVGAALALLVTLVFLVLPRSRSARGHLGISALLAALPVAVGVLVLVPALAVPVIHDISTDIADPPQFRGAVELRGDASNPLVRDDKLDEMQRKGYPDLAGIDTALPPAQAFERAIAVVKTIGWEVTATDPAAGLIEASQTTFWFGFVDDIAIRVRPAANGSRIDLRSVSRVGEGDLGANARRIRHFVAEFGN